MLKNLLWGMLIAVITATAFAADAQRYTFSWPLDNSAPAPRGGTTRGAPVDLDQQPSQAWLALQQQNLSTFERDRRAILAMAGAYRSTFDFLEVLSFSTAATQRPYQSWGTEKVYVDSDTGKAISLVHILEMRIVMGDGSLSEPIVTKHWRQDWQYEPDSMVEYRGNATWQRRALSGSERKGRWLQTVYQVDESPRYGSLGAWQHNSAFSTWISGDTWRPLPRREWSARKDYDVLIGTNRHTITSTGWVQEENNLKTRLDNGAQRYLAREYGVARYERIKDFSFAEADEYYSQTKLFWDEVRVAWNDWFKREGTVHLRGQVDQLELFAPLFEHADELASGKIGDANNQAVITRALQDMR
ncbi:MAG: hypothetical protein QM808_12120 [Steroidobacteraceae bacterium]